VTGGLRPRRRRGRHSTDADADRRKRIVRPARGHGGARDYRLERRQTAVTRVRLLSAASLLAALLLAGCGAPPGQPRAGSIELAPNEIVEFDALYSTNCAGCHGATGRGGAAIALANPVYLAIVDDGSMRANIAAGVRGTSMPAFAQGAGGMLTELQIDALVNGIRSRWSRPAALDGA